MGQFYYQGAGVKQNYLIAFEWFQKAADKKFPPAQYQVGKMLQNGEGTEFNDKLGAEYLDKACKGGLKQACSEKEPVKPKVTKK